MSFFSVFYNVGLLFLFLNSFVWTYDLFTGGYKEKTYTEKPILNDLDNWIYYYRDEMNGMRYETAEEGQQLRMKYDTLVNRRNLYTATFKRFYAIEDSFRTYNDLTVQERKSYGGAWLQDSVTLYRTHLNPIERLNTFLMLFPRGADVRTKKGVLDTATTNELNKKILEARDSVKFYDAQLEKMLKFK
jgi:uncharacterized membrane protein